MVALELHVDHIHAETTSRKLSEILESLSFKLVLFLPFFHVRSPNNSDLKCYA